jgi:CopA family copper-resistance protein
MPNAMLTRRRLLRSAAATGAGFAAAGLLPAWARAEGHASRAHDMLAMKPAAASFGLKLAPTPFEVGGRRGIATTINGGAPGPLLRWREGQDVTLNVTNALDEQASIHWHGIMVPNGMDGVPGVTFPGIAPGETFTYKFPVRQAGTYWYHSHSRFQEQTGVYGPIVIEPAAGERVQADREHIIVLSDWTFENPERVWANLKRQSDYYNFQRRTVADFFRDSSGKGLGPTVSERGMWGRMRMDATDLADVTGATYTYLVNGRGPAENWTAVYKPGERVRLRFINASSMTYFDLRIPGLPMTVVSADGQDVEPVETDEIRLAIAETYDVIVTPPDDRPFTIFAESMDRSGYARATLATREGVSAAIPPRRTRPVRSMADMGHAMGGMDMSGSSEHDMSGMGHDMPGMSGRDMSQMGRDASTMPGHDMSGMDHDMPAMPGHDMSSMSNDMPGMSGHDMSGMNHNGAAAPVGDPVKRGPGVDMRMPAMASRLDDPGIGLGKDGWRVLSYAQLRAARDSKDARVPAREIPLHLTGNMQRYMWSFDGVKFSDAKAPIAVGYGERVRIVLINETMMEHPIHLHGMLFELDNGAGARRPSKHTVNVKPGERLPLLLTADEPGDWAFHCHLLYHMTAGMMRVVRVSGEGARA